MTTEMMSPRRSNPKKRHQNPTSSNNVCSRRKILNERLNIIMINLDNKKKLPVALTIYFSLILIVITIGQYDKLSSVFTSILSVLSPLIIGFTLAYLLNPILNLYEKKVFKFIKNKRALRILGVDRKSVV